MRYYIDCAQKAEAAHFNSIFLADLLAVPDDIESAARCWLEPVTTLAALAIATSRIGLIATASTTYNEPFHVARKFASLDHISGGRAAWNIVTSASEAEAHNFGIERPAHRDRYARATEFLEVVNQALGQLGGRRVLGDHHSGNYADTDRIHTLDHIGAHFRVRGPLNTSRPPQGHPLLVQAGSSEDGKEFAARFAEAVFTAQQTLADGQ